MSNWEKIFANHIPEKGPEYIYVYKYIKNSQLSNKKANHPVLKWINDL